MQEITVSELKSKQKQLESELTDYITTRLNNFYEETGVTVDSLDTNTITAPILSADKRVLCEVTTYLDLQWLI